MKIVHYLLLLVISIILLEKAEVVYGNGDFYYSYIPEENADAGKRLYTNDKNINSAAYEAANIDVDVISNIEIQNDVDATVDVTASDKEAPSLGHTGEIKRAASNNITNDNDLGSHTNNTVVRNGCHNDQDCSGDQMDDIAIEFLNNLMESSTEKKNKNTFFQKNNVSLINGDNRDSKEENSIDGGDEQTDYSNIVDEEVEIIANEVPVNAYIYLYGDKASENNSLNGKSAKKVAPTGKGKKQVQAQIKECASLYLNWVSSASNKFTDKMYNDPEWWLSMKKFFDAKYSTKGSNTSSNDTPIYSNDTKKQDSDNGSSSKNALDVKNNTKEQKKQLTIKKCKMLLSKLIDELSAGNMGQRTLSHFNTEQVDKVSRGYLRWEKPEVEGSGEQQDALSYLEMLFPNENETDTSEKHSLGQNVFVDLMTAENVEASKKLSKKDQANTTKKIDGASVKIKSVKNFNNREKIKIIKLATKDEKTKEKGSFLEHPEVAQDLLNSEMTSDNYVREASENAFDDNEMVHPQSKTSVTDKNMQNKENITTYANPDTSKTVTNKNDLQLNTSNHTDQLAFVEKSGTHGKYGSGKKHKGKHISKKNKKSKKHHDNNSRNVHKRDAKVKKHSHKTETTNKNNSKGHKSHVKGDTENDNKQDEYEDDDEEEDGDDEEEEDEDEDYEEEEDEDDEEEKEKKKKNKKDDNEDNDEEEDDDEEEEEEEEEEKKHTKVFSNSKQGGNEKPSDKEKDTSSKMKSDNDNTPNSVKGTEKKNTMVEHEVNNINRSRKVYDLNLYNCSLIKDWDLTHEYMDEQGTLVKLSGYIFQNTLNSYTMPTINIDEWKLKGVCEFEKYVCGALKYMPNEYSKGERVIFEEQIYEALVTTRMSPKDDESAWVDKTNDCSEE